MTDNKKEDNLKVNYSCIGNYKIPIFKQKDILAVDIGCNTGNFIKKYRSIFDTIYFYEINKNLFDYVSNIYKDDDKIIGFNKGVDDSKKESKLLIHKSKDAGSTALDNDNIVVKEWNEKFSYTIECIDLYTVIETAGGYINYMKMDCETSEYNILMNKNLSNIEFLAIEIHWQLGRENWNRLLSHIYKYFNDYKDQNTEYPDGFNKELHFISKQSKNIKV